MPYTPPSHRSPSTSAPPSPDVSRRPSFQAGGSRPSLPRSASYLTRHRRTPSAIEPSNHGQISQPTPEATSEDLKGMVTGASVRQSPPPVTDGRQMPTGAVISPPDSSSSDEDDLPEVRGRRIENLRELHDAISQIPQHRESSPTKTTQNQDAGDLLILPSQANVISHGLQQSLSTGSLEALANGGRRTSHPRPTTEPHELVTKSADNSLTGSEEESEEEMLRKKPQMVRKKSGELVRPALRPPSRRRPSSMPGTPTFSKAVHFDSHLEHVRHFLQVDRPLAVSAGSSPADNYESDTEYPFPSEERRNPPFEWEIMVTGFPVETAARKALPARLERVWLSNDQKCLTGSIAVANLAFQKFVTCRFTLDYWKTTSEVAAEYVAEIRPKETPQGHDRFQFTIKLSDLANLESKTLYFCIRYNTNGQEFWDNNGGINFQVDFKKKMLPQNGKNGFQGAASRPANGLPRSTRRSNPSLVPRPKSMPVGFEGFGDSTKIDFSKAPSLQEYLGDAGPALRLKGVKSTTSLPSDNLTSRLSSPSGQAFANRYDFSASLTAAVQAAKDAMSKPDGLYMRSGRKPAVAVVTSNPDATVEKSSAANDSSATANKALPPLPSGTDSPNISNASYDEIVSKYCFFGSKQSSPQIKEGTLRSGQVDGALDGLVTQATNSTNSSSNGSPLQMLALRNVHGAQHHSLHPKDPNPYFEHAVHNVDASVAVASVHLPMQQASSPAGSVPRVAAPASGRSTTRSVSPASMVGAFAPFAGTSPTDFSYQQLQDRFPFAGTEAHAATTIRG